MAVLGLDLGERRVGVAFNPFGLMVIELNTLEWTTAEGLVADLGLLISEKNIDTVVFGRPRADSSIERLVIMLADRLSNVSIVQLDETLTTKEAERQVAVDGKRGDTDAIAARLILEQYLSERLAE